MSVPDPVVRGPKQVSLEWAGLEDLPILAATNFATAVVASNEIMLVIGQAVPPILSGTAQEQADKIMELDVVTAHPLVRVLLTPKRVQDLIGMLNVTLAQHGQVVELENARRAENE
jgi:hypothetical protein